MANTKFDARQSVLRAALGMVGSAANDSLDTIFPKIDAELAKLFEDRNILLTDGGLVTYTGTTVQFTESLKLSVNSRVAGGSPVVIDLGSTTRTVSVSGRMIYAVIDRSAGTATVTDDSATLPAVTSANQEVFLLAKRVDATDGTKRIYWRNGSAFDEGQTARLGSAGSGSGSGLGDDINTLKFRASFNDPFDDKKAVNSSAGFTDDTLYSAGKKLYRLNYDASKTVTGTGTAMTLSGAPAFTIKAGDVLVVASEVRRISAISSQTSVTIESAFSSNPAAAAVNVSQAVHTVDLASFTDSGAGLALNSVYADTLSSYMISYRDSAALDDAVFDNATPAIIGFTASTNNSTWTSVGTRADSIAADNSKRATASSGTSFYLRFFANKTTGSGAVNVLDYKVFLYEDTTTSSSGGVTSKALARTDGAGTSVNCSVSSSTGKTRITTTFVTGSEINVYLNGQKLPEFVDATLTSDSYFKRITGTVIELDNDYSGAGLQVEIILPSATVDNTNVNALNVAALQDYAGSAFQGFVAEAKLTAVNGTPGAGQFRTFGVSARAQIPDLANDLRARLGIDRIPIQQAIELQNEFGPNGEKVFKALNDDRELIRFVGPTWNNTNDSNGQYVISGAGTTDFVEVVFYGTGLNLLTTWGNQARDVRVTIDNGSEGANIIPQSPNIIIGRGYNVNIPVPVTSGLALGLHTIRLRNATAAQNFYVFGFEVLNEAATINVRPGTAYVNGKKLALSAAQSLSFNSTFESIIRDGASQGSIGARGGRVIVYQKSDGTVAKAINETDSTQKNLASADHSNEEMSRTYYFREFSAPGRSDDFGGFFPTSGSNSATFPLEDNTTVLTCFNCFVNTGTQAIQFNTVTNAFVTLTFVGTGVDVTGLRTTSSTATAQFIVDGVVVGSSVISSTVALGQTKIVSGLPYGTHTLKILFTASAGGQLEVSKFVVYQPKKASLPAGAVELADYNLMATYDGSTITGTAVTDFNQVALGTLFKTPFREMTYLGANWAAGGVDTSAPGGGTPSPLTNNGQAVQYTFFGTGFVLGMAAAASTYDFTVTIDGSLNASGVARSNASNLGGGSYRSTSTTGAAPCRIEFTGLTLGTHTISIPRSAGSGNMNFAGLWIITPVHTPKPNQIADIMNSLPVGSCALSDNRKLSAVKSEAPKKNWVQGNANMTTSATVSIPVMALTFKTNGGKARLMGQITARNNSNTDRINFNFWIDGVLVSPFETANMTQSAGNGSYAFALMQLVELSPGVHIIEIRVRCDSGSAQASVQLSVEET